MSTYTVLCDSILAEVLGKVTALQTAQVHRYTPRSVENLIEDVDKHLACWAAAEGPCEEAEPLTTGTSWLRYSIGLAYWEPDDEADDLRADEDAAAAMFTTLEAVRAVFFSDSFRAQQGGWMDWVGAEVGVGGTQAGGLVRWWVAEISVRVPVDHTA